MANQKNVRIFVGYSGETSKKIARALVDWIDNFFEDGGVETFMADRNLIPGSDWKSAIDKYLQTAEVGIFCLTEKNCAEEWINYEAGSIKNNSLGGNKLVVPFLIDIDPNNSKLDEIWKGPLKKEEAADSSSQEKIKNMMYGINGMLRRPYPDFESLFSSKYEELKTRIEQSKGDTNDEKGLDSGFPAIQAPLTQWENEVLWVIFGKGNAVNSYYTNLVEINHLVLSNKYSYGEIHQALILLQARGYIQKNCDPPGYRLTIRGKDFMQSQLRLAFEQGFIRINDCK